MAVGTPVLENTTQWADSVETQTTTAFDVASGEAVVLAYFSRTTTVLAPTLSGGVGAPNPVAQVQSPFEDRIAVLAVWAPPAAGSYTITTNVSFIDSMGHVLTVPNVDGTTPADGAVSDNANGASDTGTFNVTSATGDMVIMACQSGTGSIVGDGTELADVEIAAQGHNGMVQYAVGAATVDIGAALDSGTDSCWVGLNLNDAGGGGGGISIPVAMHHYNRRRS